MLPSFGRHIQTLEDLDKFQNLSFSDIEIEIFPFCPGEDHFVIDIINFLLYPNIVLTYIIHFL